MNFVANRSDFWLRQMPDDKTAPPELNNVPNFIVNFVIPLSLFLLLYFIAFKMVYDFEFFMFRRSFFHETLCRFE